MTRSKRFRSALSVILLLGTGVSLSGPGCAAVDDPTAQRGAPEDVGAAAQRDQTAPRRIMNIVAHQDDDLIFMNPDIQNDIARGAVVQTVVVTGEFWSAGPAYAPCVADACATPVPYEQRRELGSQAAYSTMAQVSVGLETSPGLLSPWVASTQTVAIPSTQTSKRIYSATLPQTNVSVVYLRLGAITLGDTCNPDLCPGRPKIVSNTGIVSLWDGQGTVMSQDLSAPPQKLDDYTREEVIGVLAELIKSFNPDLVRVQDSSGTPTSAGAPPMDHDEHTVTSRFAIAALSSLPTPIPYTEYRGYNIANELANVSGPDLQNKVNAFGAYGAWDLPFNCPALDPSTCWTDGKYNAWIHGRYTVPSTVATYWSTFYWPSYDGSTQAGDLSTTQEFTDTSETDTNNTDPGDTRTPTGTPYPGTFHLADVTGDGLPDACMRYSSGIWCAQNLGGNIFASHTLWGDAFADTHGWSFDYYGSTIQFADIDGDGKADVCGRGYIGIQCTLSSGTGFQAPTWWSYDFADSSGWATQAAYYDSIRLVDIDGDGYADLCGRGYIGILCALNNKHGGFGTTRWATTDAFGNSQGWSDPSYGTTIQFGDVDGDGKVDVCGRGPNGIQCELGTGTGFFQNAFLASTNFTSAAGWTSPASWGSIRLVDVNGDGKADVCGRQGAGIFCGLSQGTSFATPTLWNGTYSDANGWNTTAYGPNIQFADLNRDHKADVCGRGPYGLECAKSQ